MLLISGKWFPAALVLVLAFCASALETANPKASPAAKAILDYYGSLAAKPEQRLLTGQFIGYNSGVKPAMLETIKAKVGDQVAIVGGDYADYGSSHRIAYEKTNTALIAAWKTGALVALQIHMTDPAGVGLRSPTTNLEQLLTPGNPVYDKWMAQMDLIAAGLKQLQDNGVVVLFRPFHEMNGAWFWWGGKDPALFARLWKRMFEHFTVTKGLDNILWVYGPNHGTRPDRWYPGSAYVDITGLDAYTSNIGPAGIQGYPDMIKLGKPFGFTEFGPENPDNPSGDFDYRKFVGGMKTGFPNAVFFMSWDGDWSLASNQFVAEALKDPYVGNRSALPGNWDGGTFLARRMRPRVTGYLIGTVGTANPSIFNAGSGSWVDMRGRISEF